MGREGMSSGRRTGGRRGERREGGRRVAGDSQSAEENRERDSRGDEEENGGTEVFLCMNKCLGHVLVLGTKHEGRRFRPKLLGLFV